MKSRSAHAPIARHEIFMHRRGLIGWSIAILSLVAIEFAVYPTVRDTPDVSKLVESYPEELRAFLGINNVDFGSAKGFLSTELFGLMIPLLLAIFVIVIGARALAGEEESRTMAMLLAQPVSRTRIVIEKAFGTLILTLLMTAIVFLSLVIGAQMTNMDISVGSLFAAMAASFALAISFGFIAFLVGSIVPSRAVAWAVSCSLLVLAYVVNSLGEIVDWLDAPRRISPFYQTSAAEALNSGVPWGPMFVAIVMSVVFVALSGYIFNARDVSV